ncbi:PAS domain S-box protein [Alienimonas californiensis]|uniref:PAS domain S-box protein n=1 Tax=Alienimonas californiensis TaxID=2527989 RepID=UPI0013FCF846|nr:PAS domain S-box protein [Alienimonas californiensis]
MPLEPDSLRAALIETGCGVFWLDDGLCVRRANAAFLKMSGRSQAELIGSQITEIDPGWPHGGPAETFERLRRTMAKGHATRLRRPGGGLWPVQMHVHLMNLAGCESLFGLAVDTSDRQAAEDALRASERRYRAVTADQTEFIVRCTPDLFVTFCNPAYAKLVDQGDPTRIVGRRTPDLVQKADVEPINRMLHSLNPDRPVADFENVVPTPDGGVVRVAWSIRAIFDPDESGEPRVGEYQCVGRDVTESRRMYESLVRTEARYRSLVEDSPELVSRWRPDGSLTFANRAYRDYFGLDAAVDVDPIVPQGASRPAADPTGAGPGAGREREPADGYHNVFERIDSATRTQVHGRIRAMTPETPHSRMIVGCPRRDGVVRQLEWIKRGIFNEERTLVEVHSVARDVTERLEAQTRLVEGERRYREVLDDLTEMVNRFRPEDGLITYANRAFLEAKGGGGREVVGRMTIYDHLDPEAAHYARTHLAAVTPEEPSVRALLPLPGPAGVTRWEEWTNRALFAPPDPGNPGAPRRVLEFQSVGRDVTVELAIRHRQKERREALEELEKLTPRERQVLRAVATGVTNKVIARTLDITERTVEKHRGAAMRKLGVRSAAELIRAVLAAEEVDAYPPVQIAGGRNAVYGDLSPSN